MSATVTGVTMFVAVPLGSFFLKGRGSSLRVLAKGSRLKVVARKGGVTLSGLRALGIYGHRFQG